MDRVLIVDDNLPFAENLAEILEDAGMVAEVVSGGAAALERIAATHYRLLISDMRMPNMGGAELVARARQLDPALPAIIVSAYTTDGDLEAARKQGLLGVLPKPAPLARLLEFARQARRDALVIVVEDDAAFADNLSEALGTRGFPVLTAASLEETERLGGQSPLCALVDLRVPGGPDGAALSQLGRIFPELPLIVVTAYDDLVPSQPHAALFRKPFRVAELLDAIEQLHSTRAARSA